MKENGIEVVSISIGFTHGKKAILKASYEQETDSLVFEICDAAGEALEVTDEESTDLANLFQILADAFRSPTDNAEFDMRDYR